MDKQFFDIGTYPTKSDYRHNTSYIRVLNGKGENKEGEELNNRTQIQVRWKDGKETIHEVITKVEESSIYCQDEGRNWEDHKCYPYINIVHNDMIVKEVPLWLIQGIKVRITFQGTYSFEQDYRETHTHSSKEDDIAKGEKIVEVDQYWKNDRSPLFYVPDESKPIVCCPSCLKEMRREHFKGQELYTTVQWCTTINGYKLCPFCTQAKGFYCQYIVPEKPKPKPVVICSGCVAAKSDPNVVCKKHGCK